MGQITIVVLVTLGCGAAWLGIRCSRVARSIAEEIRAERKSEQGIGQTQPASLSVTRALAAGYVRHLVEISGRAGLAHRSPIGIDRLQVWQWSSRRDSPTDGTRPLAIEYSGGEVATLHLDGDTRTSIPVPRDGSRKAKDGVFVLVRAEFLAARRVEVFDAEAIEETHVIPTPNSWQGQATPESAGVETSRRLRTTI